MDFTLPTYTSLLTTLLRQGYSFSPLEELPFQHPGKAIVLRHDVDLLPKNSLRTAIIEKELGIRGTYYFRIVPESNRREIIEQIRDLGHEIGYHYEDLTLAGGNMEAAHASFTKNLEYFRGFYPVKTICMHGSPMSRWDSRDLWKHFDYRKLGIICEPYFDIDFNRAFYLTDTGRRWDGWKVSIRDKMPQQAEWNHLGLRFHSTPDIIRQALANQLPNHIMITIHPQRWTDKMLPWVKEWAWQGVKNGVKFWMGRYRG